MPRLSGELTRDRPASADLTEFYLDGRRGCARGRLQCLVAPLLFGSIVEYPLMIVAALLVASLGDGSATPVATTNIHHAARLDMAVRRGWR